MFRVRTLALRLGLLGFCIGWAPAFIGCGHGRLGPSEPSYPRAGDPYVESLVARARALQLWEQPQWHKLLHYRLSMFGKGFLGGGYTSEADGIGFFLAPRGKVDPQDELEAMIAHFERLLEPRGYFRPHSRATATRRTLRTMLTKPGWNHLEVRTLRGVLSALERSPRDD